MSSYKYMDKRKEVFLLVTSELILESASAIYDAMQNGLIDELDRYYENSGGDKLYGSVVIWNRYSVSFLGEGYMGYVLRIDDMDFDNTFAIKVGILNKDEGDRNYIGDGMIATRLSDFPEIVNVYAYENWFCIMEFIDGFIGSFYQYDQLESLAFFTDMDRLIREVYDAGYGMFDLHLNNVMFTYEGDLRIIDVGNYYDLSDNYLSLDLVLEQFENDVWAMCYG